MREGQGRARGGLRAHAGRAGVLRLRGDHGLESFKAGCDVIVVNHWSDELADVVDRCTRGVCLRGTRGEMSDSSLI